MFNKKKENGMKKFVMIMVAFLLVCGWWGCHDITVGYLRTDNALYLPDSMEVRRVLDPNRTPDKVMITSGADWASNQISGVDGTDPITYEITGVKASEGGDADLFMEQVRIIGGGRFYFPSKDIKAPNGRYTLSIRVSNPGYSAELEDIFTIIIK